MHVFSSGFFNGTVSSFMHWPEVLPPSEIQGLSGFYRNMIDYHEEPTLSARELRSFLPVAFQHCIRDRTTLSNFFKKPAECKANI